MGGRDGAIAAVGSRTRVRHRCRYDVPVGAIAAMGGCERVMEECERVMGGRGARA